MSAPRLSHPLSEEVVELVSARLTLVADPTRIRILDELRAGEANVQSITDALATTQQNVSGHLRLLLAGSVVSRRPVGRKVIYAVADETVYEVWERAIAGMQGRRH